MWRATGEGGGEGGGGVEGYDLPWDVSKSAEETLNHFWEVALQRNEKERKREGCNEERLRNEV